jgi:hypothetical protein
MPAHRRHPGGRSTHGVCAGVLSWLIDEGRVDKVDLAGQPVALAMRYSDDEPGPPWTWILYLDDRASEQQQRALEGIFTGQLGGDAAAHFPWTWKEGEFVGVRIAGIDVEQPGKRGAFHDCKTAQPCRFVPGSRLPIPPW